SEFQRRSIPDDLAGRRPAPNRKPARAAQKAGRGRRRAPGLRYTRPAYPLCINLMRRRGAPLSSVPVAVDRSRPVPDIVTEIPGPKARAHVAFDETWTSRSLPRAYPIVPVRGSGVTVEDIDGNLFLDFAAGIAVTSTGPSHPAALGASNEQAADT